MIIPVIILNYNSSFDCRKCVSFLQKQKNVELEIIIVDNCSAKEDVVQIELLCAEQDVTLLKSETNKGYSAGNNVGLRYAANKGYDYALVINPDMELHDDDYIESLANKFLSDKSIAVVGSDILNNEGQHQNPQRELTFNEEFFWFFELIKKKLAKSLPYTVDYKQSTYCHKLSGCCFMISLSFLEKVGFLDENTFLYCEEAILGKQVDSQNMQMYYMADKQAIHMHIKSAKGNALNRWKQFFKSRRYYTKKHSGYGFIKKQLLILSSHAQELVVSKLIKN